MKHYLPPGSEKSGRARFAARPDSCHAPEKTKSKEYCGLALTPNKRALP